MLLRGLRRAGAVPDTVVAACDSDLGRAGLYAASHGAAVATVDPVEAMAHCDVVWICTPTATHRGLVELAAERGLAVYCEKPLAPTLAESERLAEVADAHGLRVQVGLVLRHAPATATLRAVLDSGRLGRPLAAALTDDQYFPIQGQYASAWRADVAIAGGGTLIEHSIHDLDLLAALLGPVDAVTGYTANFAGHTGIEDVAAFTMRHGAGGATSSLTSVWHSILSRPSTRRLEVFCERGIVSCSDEHVGPVTLLTDAGSEELPSGLTPEQIDVIDAVMAAIDLPPSFRAGVASYVLADRAFLESCRAGTAPAPGLDVALEAHRVADAAYRAAADL